MKTKTNLGLFVSSLFFLIASVVDSEFNICFFGVFVLLAIVSTVFFVKPRKPH